MENKLEQLLNSLIEKDWKPFGDERIVPYVKIDCRQIAFYKSCDDWMYQWLFDTDIRTVLSKESNLWQFVCENGMVDKQHWYIEELKWWKADDDEEWHDNWEERYSTEYQYWLIESSLKDESELESFILDNIKV